jgi:hypothetical protein
LSCWGTAVHLDALRKALSFSAAFDAMEIDLDFFFACKNPFKNPSG